MPIGIYKRTDWHRKLLSKLMKRKMLGHIPWNKGLKIGKPSSRRTGENRICQFCGKEFYVPGWKLKRGWGIFCDQICFGKSKFGSKISEEHKRKIGKKQTGEKSHFWKGGRYKRPDGVVMIYRPNHPFTTYDKHVREHRLVMEVELGRYLLSREVVHHIDGDRSNNEINNLMLFSNQSEHKRFERAYK